MAFKKILLPCLILFGISCGKPPQTKISLWDNGRDSAKYKVPDHDSLAHFSISSEGNRVCLLYKKGNKWHVIINNRRFDKFTATFNDSFGQQPRITVSPNGQRVGLTYRKPRSWQTASEQFNNHGSADTSQWYVQIDQHIFGGFDSDFAPRIVFSQNGQLFGFVYKKGGSYYVQLGDTTFGPYLKADFTINQQGEVFIAYLKDDGFARIERVEKVHGD